MGALWSQTHKCWYVLYNKENYKLILHNFNEVELLKDENIERQTEPALNEHEIVHIAGRPADFSSTVRLNIRVLSLKLLQNCFSELKSRLETVVTWAAKYIASWIDLCNNKTGI